MDAEVAALVREQRLLEAAQLASSRGDARAASRLYEQACSWSLAAVEALRADEAPRALRLAVYGGDGAVAEQAFLAVVREGASMATTAAQLVRLGHGTWAARLLEAYGRAGEAARLWEQAGEPRKAAAAFGQAGEPAEAARVLQETLAREPQRWDLTRDLGELLGSLGRWEACARTLQRIPAESPERAAALVGLVVAFEHLGFLRAAADLRTELTALGGVGRDMARPAPPVSPGAPAANVFGRYTLLREVASSPYARLLQCHDPILGESVAIKVYTVPDTRREPLARYGRDVLAVRSLHHPAIVPLREHLPEACAAVLAWMGGGSLEDLAASFGRFAPARAAEVAGAVLTGLAAAHRVGVVHRDVKPANVLFDEAGGAKLTDFGTAHLADVGATATTRLLRVLAYVSPEQRDGRPATERSDVYSVGVLLGEMLTGEAPNPYRPPRTTPSQARPELDARHDLVVARMTACDPSERPGSAFEALAALGEVAWPETIVEHGTPRVVSGGPPSAPPEEGRLGDGANGVVEDLWMGRAVEAIPAVPASLARARAFALADDDGLQGIWRVDERAGAIWLERLEEEPLDGPLSEDQRDRLRRALEALHRAGAAHGHVDRRHVVAAPRGLVLRFEGDPERSAPGTPGDAAASGEGDLEALRKL